MHDLQALPCPANLVVPVAGSAICNAVTGAAGSAVSGVGGSILSSGFTQVFRIAGQWVAQGAGWLLGRVGDLMSATTTVGLGTRWFTSHEHLMAALAAAVIVPMACVGAIQAIYRQSPSVLGRSFLVHLPLAMLLTGVSVELVQLGLSVTDTLSRQALDLAGTDTRNALLPVSSFLVAGGFGVPPFVVFFAALVVAVCSFVLWLELVVRAAAVAAATLFLPMCLAALVWPAISHWCRRLAETIAALVLSKFVIAAVISLAAGALAGGLGVSGSNGGGFAAVATGVALLVIATICPFTVLKMIPAIEAGAVGHLESVRHRLTGAASQSQRSVINLAREAAGLVESVSSGGSSLLVAGASAAGGTSTPSVGGSPSIGKAGSSGADDGDGRGPAGGGIDPFSPTDGATFAAAKGQDQETQGPMWPTHREVTAAASPTRPGATD